MNIKLLKDDSTDKEIAKAFLAALKLRRGAKNVIIIIEDADGFQHIINAPLKQRDAADLLLFLQAYIMQGYFDAVE